MSEGKKLYGQLLNKPDISSHLIKDDGHFPNNSFLPLIIYSKAVEITGDESIRQLEKLLNNNGWSGSWINGVFPYHHYHSTAHEFLIVCSGEARIQFGGNQGITIQVRRGDAVALPAGVAHKKLDESPGFQVMGSYPNGQSYDMNYGDDRERQYVDQNISQVSLPIADPLYGEDGPLMSRWK